MRNMDASREGGDSYEHELDFDMAGDPFIQNEHVFICKYVIISRHAHKEKHTNIEREVGIRL